MSGRALVSEEVGVSSDMTRVTGRADGYCRVRRWGFFLRFIKILGTLFNMTHELIHMFVGGAAYYPASLGDRSFRFVAAAWSMPIRQKSAGYTQDKSCISSLATVQVHLISISSLGILFKEVRSS